MVLDNIDSVGAVQLLYLCIPRRTRYSAAESTPSSSKVDLLIDQFQLLQTRWQVPPCADENKVKHTCSVAVSTSTRGRPKIDAKQPRWPGYYFVALPLVWRSSFQSGDWYVLLDVHLR